MIHFARFFKNNAAENTRYLVEIKKAAFIFLKAAFGFIFIFSFSFFPIISRIYFLSTPVPT